MDFAPTLDAPPKAAGAPGQPPLRVAVAGLGAIGRALAAKLTQGAIPGVELTAVSVRDQAKGQDILDSLGSPAKILPLEELAGAADLVVECLPAPAVGALVASVLEAGKKVMVLSVGVLLSRPDLTALAERHRGQIIVPTGALIGLDAVTAAAEGQIESVRIVTRKPPKGLMGAPYLVEKGIDITGLTEAKQVFAGTAREAAKGFPANLNVAAALSLAGIGPDRTQQEIWADPAMTRNRHEVTVVSDSALMQMVIENIPSENPKTGRITAQSVLAALRKINAPLRVGT
ncbi:aspartate dehydrogenase [Roseomonas chloroacetimidivorans]|jgi:aspartate dehydrogenase|uniref:aspartate dehydrogenase n=1 Tax=Roseomonas chloroacetimidivorans TaxID=1766656 RepID=UPI003C72F55E